MSTSTGDTLGAFGPSEADLRHRQQTEAFVADGADPALRPILTELLAAWHTYNDQYFDGRMQVPYIEIDHPKSRKAWGDYLPVTGIGGKSGIRLLPNILSGKHKQLRAGQEFAAGRKLFLFDALLHEMVHQFAEEELGKPEVGYGGYGGVYRDECNRIGAMLGLPRVRLDKNRGEDKDLPNCLYWPHNVRPADYYQGAYVPDGDAAEDDAEEPASQSTRTRETVIRLPLDPRRQAKILADLHTSEEVVVFLSAYLSALAEQGKVPAGETDDTTLAVVPIDRDADDEGVPDVRQDQEELASHSRRPERYEYKKRTSQPHDLVVAKRTHRSLRLLRDEVHRDLEWTKDISFDQLDPQTQDAWRENLKSIRDLADAIEQRTRHV